MARRAIFGSRIRFDDGSRCSANDSTAGQRSLQLRFHETEGCTARPAGARGPVRPVSRLPPLLLCYDKSSRCRLLGSILWSQAADTVSWGEIHRAETCCLLPIILNVQLAGVGGGSCHGSSRERGQEAPAAQAGHSHHPGDVRRRADAHSGIL